MAYVIRRQNDTLEVVSGPVLLNDGRRTNLATLESASDDELAALSVQRVADPTPPAGKVLQSISYQLNGDVIEAVGTFIDDPEIKARAVAAIDGTWRASLRRKAAYQETKGNVVKAVNLYLEAYGVPQ